jgi:hypothetical protein
VSSVDWWAPLRSAGRLEVRELLSPDSWVRYFAADPEASFELATFWLLGGELRVSARRSSRSVSCDDQVIGELDFSAVPDPAGGWEKPLTLFGTPGLATRHADEDRGSRVRGPLRFLRIASGQRRWVWHFEGGRAAGERLVLSRAEAPGAAAPLVTTYPAGHGRRLGNPQGGATWDAHVTDWHADASAAEVVLAELLAVARLDGLVDYRPARVAGGFSELLHLAPRAEANTD